VYKSEAASVDYHGQMNRTDFEKRVHQKLVPNLSHASVIVLDNAIIQFSRQAVFEIRCEK